MSDPIAPITQTERRFMKQISAMLFSTSTLFETSERRLRAMQFRDYAVRLEKLRKQMRELGQELEDEL